MSFRVYLAGAIELIGYAKAQEWRDQAMALAEEFAGWQPVNPLDWESPEGPWNDEELVNKDRYLLGKCDAVLMDGRQPGWGTGMELAWAHDLGIPVVVWGIARDEAPVFLRHHTTIFEPHLTDAVMRVAELSLE